MDQFRGSEPGRRRTLKSSIGCVGIGVHSGRRAGLVLRPAPAGAGLLFRRRDLGLDIPARFDNVTDTRLCTTLAHPHFPEARIGTVEHVLAALAGCGIDDAIIEVDGPEVPILDGSAAPFVFLIDCAGVTTQPGAVAVIEVLRPVRVRAGVGADTAWAELAPLRPHAASFLPGNAALEASLTIEYPGTAIGRQHCTMLVTPGSFRSQLANARTFTLAEEVERMRAKGLAQGGSLDNAVVVEGRCVLNPGGLRRPDEFVRHKLVDVVGDLALAGAPLRGLFAGHRSGHALNNRLLRALFADASAWRHVPAARAADGAAPRLPAAAYPAVD
jgi:UDP-3-O-[3-hydroxymyristoyl] N-acetylglucosamine deacetylase